MDIKEVEAELTKLEKEVKENKANIQQFNKKVKEAESLINILNNDIIKINYEKTVNEKNKIEKIEKILDLLEVKDYELYFYNCFSEFREDNSKEIVLELLSRMDCKEKEEAKGYYPLIFDFTNLEIKFFKTIDGILDYLKFVLE